MTIFKPEKFFELIDQHQVIDISIASGLLDGFYQSQRTASQQGRENSSLDLSLFLVSKLILGIVFQQRFRKVVDWTCTRPCNNYFPIGTCIREETSVQNGHYPTVNERRFTTTAGANNTHETALGKFKKYFITLPFATEEQVAFFNFKWS
jgi:hypothetical protein